MTRSALPVLALFAATLLPACDLVTLPESGPEMATYYVSANRVTGAPTTNATSGFPTRIAIEYISPDGVKRDTIRGAVSWSRVFERSKLAEFRLTATNLTVDTTRTQLLKGFVGATLSQGSTVIAKDSSKAVVSLDAANPVIETPAQ